MEVVELCVTRRPMRRGDVELPRQRGGPPEGLLVEEVPPPSDGLADREARRRHVEAAQHRQAPEPGEPYADERAEDESAVNGEAALPHRDDLRGVLAVVVPIEDDFVRARADEPGEDGPLRGADDVVGGKALLARPAVAEPEADHDRRRHQDAIPADGEATDPKTEGSGRGEHLR